MSNENPLSKIEHIVVLMLENRSFDNLLGWLYDHLDKPWKHERRRLALEKLAHARRYRRGCMRAGVG